jgi:hypothetical protein
LSQPNSFLAIILQLPFPKTRLNSICLLPSSYPGRLASRNSTQLHTAPASFRTLLYIYFTRTTQKTQPFYCWEGVFTAPLHSNGSYSVVTCVFSAAGMCLPSRFPTMNIYSDFAIPTFGRHVTILKTSVSFFLGLSI